MSWYRQILADGGILPNKQPRDYIPIHYQSIGHEAGKKTIIWSHDGRKLSTIEQTNPYNLSEGGHGALEDTGWRSIASGRIDVDRKIGSFSASHYNPTFRKCSAKILADLAAEFPDINFIQTNTGMPIKDYYNTYLTAQGNAIVKKASTDIIDKRENKIQKSWSLGYGDVQRWKTDAIQVRAYLSKTFYKITVSLDVWNAHNGELEWQEFWRFGLKDMKKAEKVYDDVCDKTAEVVDKFVMEEIPTTLVHAYLRHELRKMHPAIAKSNIPNINYSYQINYEPDWRKTLYGTRYPSPEDQGTDTTGF